MGCPVDGMEGGNSGADWAFEEGGTFVGISTSGGITEEVDEGSDGAGEEDCPRFLFFFAFFAFGFLFLVTFVLEVLREDFEEEVGAGDFFFVGLCLLLDGEEDEVVVGAAPIRFGLCHFI